MRFDASTGMARVGLAQRDVGAALLALRSLLQLARANVEGDVFNEAAMASELVGADAAVGDFDGVEYPRLIELTIHRVFAVAGDPRAAAWLQRAHCKLMAQADAITDAALRQMFMTNIPHHREIVALWESRQAAQ